MTAAERRALARMKQLVAARLDLHEMVLFGSRARGDAEPDSDMDVLVVVETSAASEAEDVVSECAWEAGFESGMVVLPIVFTRQEWERGPERHSLLAQAVRAEGIPI